MAQRPRSVQVRWTANLERLEDRRLLAATPLVVQSDVSASIQAVAADGRGNLFAVGTFAGTATFGSAATTQLTARSDRDLFVMRVAADSSVLVRRIASRSGNVSPANIHVRDGVLAVAGTFTDRVDFDPGKGVFAVDSVGSFDGFVLRLTASKLAFSSVRTIGGSGMDFVTGIAVDSQGNTWAGGSFSGTATFSVGQSDPRQLSSVGQSDAYLAKWSPAGNLLYLGRVGGTGTDAIRALAVDAADNVFAGGLFQGTVDSNPGSKVKNLKSTYGLVNGMLIGLGPTGGFRSSSAFTGSSFVSVDRLRLDGAGGVCVAGSFAEQMDANPGSKVASLTSAGGFDIWFARLLPSGAFSYGASIGGAEDEAAVDLLAASNGEICIAGAINSKLDVRPGKATTNLMSQGESDGFVAVYSAAGSLKGGCRIKGAGTAGVAALTRDKTHFVLAINFQGQIDLQPISLSGAIFGPSSLRTSSVPATALVRITPTDILRS